MKIMVSFLSLVIIFFGIIPFFGEGFIIPNSGTIYIIELAILGAVVIAMAFINQLLIGFERFFLILQGIMVLGIAGLTFLPQILSFVPRGGIMFSLMIIIVGAVGLIYGIAGMS